MISIVGYRLLLDLRWRGILLSDGASRAEPRFGAHAADIDGAKGNSLPRDGWSALLRRAERA